MLDVVRLYVYQLVIPIAIGHFDNNKLGDKLSYQGLVHAAKNSLWGVRIAGNLTIT